MRRWGWELSVACGIILVLLSVIVLQNAILARRTNALAQVLAQTHPTNAVQVPSAPMKPRLLVIGGKIQIV